MKTLILLTLALSTAHARLGENIDQLVTRFGTRPRTKLIKDGELWTFTTPTLIIAVQSGGFNYPRSKCETYTKANGELWTDKEVLALCNQMITGYMTYPRTILNDDGSIRWNYLKSREKEPEFSVILEADRKSFSIGPVKGWREISAKL